jgi:RNA polymerase sigma-70 factor, ECF subfamily
MDDSEGSACSREQRFTEMFGACYSSLLAYAMRRVTADLAQDVVAEAFLAAWRNLDQLPPQPLPWLYRAAQFAIANQRRSLARRARLDVRARLMAGTGDAANAVDHADRIADDMELAVAFRTLSEPDREVLRLAAWEGLTAAAIGEVIGCSTVAAKARLHRARHRLSRHLDAKTQARPSPCVLTQQAIQGEKQ